MSIYQVLITIVWVVAIALIIRSKRTSGGEKVAWVFVTLVLSWIGVILYLILAPLSSKKSESV